MGKRIPNRNKSNDYINNDELVAELKRSYELQRPTERLCKMFHQLCVHCSGSFIYDTNEDRYDCITTAFSIVLSKWNKFDFEKRTNAFSYFTQIALNGLRAGWNQLNGNKKNTISLDNIFEESV